MTTPPKLPSLVLAVRATRININNADGAPIGCVFKNEGFNPLPFARRFAASSDLLNLAWLALEFVETEVSMCDYADPKSEYATDARRLAERLREGIALATGEKL
jgi:hypothetical protein